MAGNRKLLSKCVVWFRNDLRFHDNEVLLWAHENAEHVIPVYCFDPFFFGKTHRYKFPKSGSFKTKFILDSVQDLKTTLQSKGSDLLIFNGNPDSVIASIYDKCNFEGLAYQQEVTKEETDVEQVLDVFCKKKNVQVVALWGATLYHKDDLPFAVGRIPDTYTEFRKEVEFRAKVRVEKPMPQKLKPLPQELQGFGETLPTLADLNVQEPEKHPQSAFPFPGGETTALDRIKFYFWDSKAIEKYKITRNGLLGTEYSTKFSPWLAFGCVSPRRIFFEIKKYEAERVKNDSTYWVIFELLWRDYFRFVSAKYGNCLFYSGGIKKIKYKWNQDMDKFQLWAEGKTGVPFVDANMRELLHTGWMSNRGRQNVASFLTKDLKLDWRLGAEWFENLLIDYDVCSNYGNWNYSAGIGNDPREDRKFNMIKQGLDYDPEGDYIRAWIPELAVIKTGKVHFPWTLRQPDLNGVKIGEQYPAPILVAPEWNRHFDKTKPSSSWTANSKQKQKGIDFYFKSNSSGRR